MPTRSNDFPSARALERQDNPDLGEPEDVLSDILAGRYSVEVNIDGIAGGVPGEWTEFCNYDTLGNAVRASSEFMSLTKELLGVSLLENGEDGSIEP